MCLPFLLLTLYDDTSGLRPKCFENSEALGTWYLTAYYEEFLPSFVLQPRPLAGISLYHKSPTMRVVGHQLIIGKGGTAPLASLFHLLVSSLGSTHTNIGFELATALSNLVPPSDRS